MILARLVVHTFGFSTWETEEADEAEAEVEAGIFLLAQS